MKAYPTENEIWPYYTLTIPPPEGLEKYSIEVDAETIARWKNAAKAFFQAQEEIREHIRLQKEKDRFEELSEHDKFQHLLWKNKRATFNGIDIVDDARKLEAGMVVLGNFKRKLGFYTIKEIHSKSCFVVSNSDDKVLGWLSFSNIIGFPA